MPCLQELFLFFFPFCDFSIIYIVCETEFFDHVMDNNRFLIDLQKV